MIVKVIGYGSMGHRHARHAQALGHRVIVWDDNLDRRLLAGCDGYSTNPLLPADAVVIATPAHTHALVAQELYASGYHGPLFVEKPLALDCTAAIWGAWPHPTTMVGYNLRWHRGARAMLEELQPAEELDFRLMCDMRTWPGADYAGFLLECSHEVDLALAFGMPARPTAVKLGYQCADFNLGDGRITINAIAPDYYRAWFVARGGRRVRWITDDAALLGAQMYMDELRYFLACAGAGISTEVPFAHGLQVVQVCQDVLAGTTR